ncbi:hypothetical protein ONZ45_g17639 [Pleurotus djamor]|nr:hypothetical protein ONZ45_g17639 [Pleurotus djamor]
MDHRDFIQGEIPPPPSRSRTFAVFSGVSTAADPISNPSVANACQVLDQLADLGRALPFIAPAFILLKVIIEIENNVRDVDLKCQDLVDRITFMLGHLPMLQNITITEATRQVIDRMNAVLKDAAALIKAYRKQGRVARRLSFGNKEKFTICAKDVNQCINDLMLSLQIHQSIQIDAIVNRAVPIDPEDEAAQQFVATHGGLDVVKESRELVTQFADTLHDRVDDQTMEQLSANLSEVIYENQANLEKTINETVSTAVVDSLKGLAAQLNEAEKEQKFICVQCNQEYRDSANGPASCSFHPTDPWGRSYACCGSQEPCQFRSHRPKHHCEYPYNKFFSRAWGIINYTDTSEELASVEDTNLETNNKEKAFVSQLLRWSSRGERVEEPTLLIRVGSISWKEKYYFNTFTATELEALSAVVNITHQCTIFRTSPSNKEFAMAEWLLSRDGIINAVRLTAKVSTSALPYIAVCPINIRSCTRASDVVMLSEGGFRSCNPVGDYQIPETVRVSATLPDKPARRVRTNFKTVAPHSFPIVLKATSDPPLKANPDYARNDLDYFEGIISIVNKAPVNGGEPLTIESLTAEFRLVGDKHYQPVSTIKAADCVFPLTIDPRQSFPVRFIAEVPRSEEETKMDIRWWNRAYVAKDRPLRLKLTVTDLEGEEASLVFEYIFAPYSQEKPKPANEELAFFHFDDVDRCSRAYIRVAPTDKSDMVLVLDGNEISVTRLQQIVWQAMKTGETEVDLELGNERAGGDWEWKSWALVDLNCRRVYAIKVLLTQGNNVAEKKYACLGYVACPSYGDVLKLSKPVRHAKEKVQMPSLPPLPDMDWPVDDDVDEYTPPPPPPAAVLTNVGAGGTGTGAVLPSDMSARLTSIDNNLARIATTLEKLVELFGANGLNGHAQ